MPGSPLSDPTWPGQAADQVVGLVEKVRDRTTGPIITIARALVFGIIAVIGGLTALILFVISGTKGLQAIIEWPLDHEKAVWVSYLIMGGILLLAGAVSMSKRHAKADDS